MAVTLQACWPFPGSAGNLGSYVEADLRTRCQDGNPREGRASLQGCKPLLVNPTQQASVRVPSSDFLHFPLGRGGEVIKEADKVHVFFTRRQNPQSGTRLSDGMSHTLQQVVTMTCHGPGGSHLHPHTRRPCPQMCSLFAQSLPPQQAVKQHSDYRVF